jgi:hypothetical protein
MAPTDRKPHLPSTAPATQGAVDAFIAKLKATPVARIGGRGRLIFAIDATASREATWDRACQVQAEMFDSTAELGGLDVQLVHYRGFGEFRASPWAANARELIAQMTGVTCLGGLTQIERVLAHAAKEAAARKIGAVVFVGDAMEENVDALADKAGKLGLLGVPVFIFHEGGDADAARAFRHIAKLSGGACVPFDSKSARQLRDLLGAVAAFAAGGLPALEHYAGERPAAAALLTHRTRRS